MCWTLAKLEDFDIT
nr:unnamed protein product [Callosobruchus analis]